MKNKTSSLRIHNYSITVIKLKTVPDPISLQIYFSETLSLKDPSLRLMEIATAEEYGQLEQCQIQLQNNPLSVLIWRNKFIKHNHINRYKCVSFFFSDGEDIDLMARQ